MANIKIKEFEKTDYGLVWSEVKLLEKVAEFFSAMNFLKSFSEKGDAPFRVSVLPTLETIFKKLPKEITTIDVEGTYITIKTDKEYDFSEDAEFKALTEAREVARKEHEVTKAKVEEATKKLEARREYLKETTPGVTPTNAVPILQIRVIAPLTTEGFKVLDLNKTLKTNVLDVSNSSG